MSNYDPNAGAPGAPYASYPPQPPSYPPPAGSRTNGLAVASLVLGIVWLCGVGSILALVFGFMALSRIKRTGEGGRGMAIAGIVLGSIGAIVLVISIAALAGSGSDDDGETSTGTTEAGQTIEEGPETNSGNTENPPPEDIELTECGPGVGNPAGGNFAGAAGTITNHSSEPSSYLFNVEFVTPDGTRYSESPGSANAVAPDQTVEWGAPTVDEFREGTECRITQVERFAS
jgi:hypothetical protein